MSKLPNRYGNPHGDPEELDTTPVELPAGYREPQSLNEMLAAMVQQAIQKEEKQEFESYEEANDFEPDEEEGLLDMSPYQFDDLEEESPIDVEEHQLPAPDPVQESDVETGDQPDPNAPEPDKAD